MSYHVTFSDALSTPFKFFRKDHYATFPLGIYSLIMAFSLIFIFMIFFIEVIDGKYAAGFIYLVYSFLMLIYPSYIQAHLIAGAKCIDDSSSNIQYI